MQQRQYLFIFLLSSCWCLFFGAKQFYTQQEFLSRYEQVNTSLYTEESSSPFIKIHHHSHQRSILHHWTFNAQRDSIFGKGQSFDFDQHSVEVGPLRFGVQDIQLVESNQLAAVKEKRLADRSIWAGTNIKLDIHCLVNPKACKTCAPTFYPPTTSSPSPIAEGFSIMTPPALETSHWNTLSYPTQNEHFKLKIKNETLTTQLLNQVHIYAITKQGQEKIYSDGKGSFYSCGEEQSCQKALLNGRDITELLTAKDQSLAYCSSEDVLAPTAKESILLDFTPSVPKNLGLVLRCQQTELAGFLHQRSLALRGDALGSYCAERLSPAEPSQTEQTQLEILNKLQVSYWDKDRWRVFGEIAGGNILAMQALIFPLPPALKTKHQLRIKIEMTKGLWCLADVNLRTIHGQRNAKRYAPDQLNMIDGATNALLEDLIMDDKRYFTSFPGNEFELDFRFAPLAEGQVYELFLLSKAYYLPWLRPSWIDAKNLAQVEGLQAGDVAAWQRSAQRFSNRKATAVNLLLPSQYALQE